MNSSTQSARTSPAFNWTEYIIIPLASSIMEAQPIALVLVFFPLFLSGQITVALLDGGEIAIILYGLHVWALVARHIAHERGTEGLSTALQIGGLALVLLLVCALQILSGLDVVALIVNGAIVVWAWRRGVMWISLEDQQDERLIQTFKVGFVVVVVVLLLALLRFATGINENSNAGVVHGYMLGQLAQALPIFFLTGVIALSFTRLAIIRKEHERSGHSRLDPTRTWQFVLTVLWVAIVVAAFVLETFLLGPLRTLFGPIWNFLTLLLSELLYGLAYLLNLIFARFVGQLPSSISRAQSKQPTHIQPSKMGHMQPGSPLLNTILFILLGLVLLVVLIVIIRLVLRHRRSGQDDDEFAEEEERENLSLRAILQARRQQRQHDQQASTELATLEPGSARAHYRELLLALEQQQSPWQRQAHETPQEYQARLRRALKSEEEDDTPGDRAILAALTDAYSRERYGGKLSEEQAQQYLQIWMPHLLQHLPTNHEHNT
ncbi:MAG TPA: DUF4129 domain-containing protein [Ktedonobacteraceae bacterium]|nr:DUF4129 domain-containing protein [Ktedonobacteraceae bacterium]